MTLRQGQDPGALLCDWIAIRLGQLGTPLPGPVKSQAELSA
jgi:hypothetical protein